MDWRIKFTNIRQSMLKLKTHSGVRYKLTEFIIISYSHACATASDHPVDG
jgi:hypothetical protein